jgi:LmbE family N-acetylglucosaminyl deacetylase
VDDHARIERQRQQPAAIRLWQTLRPLRSVVTFMNTGAHPDDETSALLAALALRDGVRTVFVCSTRGEGGQNALGTEAGHDLGALRTREMEVAAEAIGMAVRWLSDRPADPVTDFGFSKHPQETFRKWGEERTIERLVRVIRQERPDIVCPTFLDVPGQHGHHRAMTQAAQRAVALAADPSAFPEHLEMGLSLWQVAKLYLPAWSGAGQSYDDDLPPPNATVLVDTGARDPVLGATYAQIAQWSRAGHKTQGMGKWLDPADDSRPLHLAWSSVGEAAGEDSILEGLPRSLSDLADSGEAPLSNALAEADREMAAALEAWPDARAVREAAARALTAVRTAISLAPGIIRHRLEQKATQLSRVMFEASGLVVRAAVSPALATPGARVGIDVHVDARDAHIDGAPNLSLALPQAWRSVPDSLAGSGAFHVEIPADAPLSDGYQAGYVPGGGNGLAHLIATFSMHGIEASHAIDLEEPLLIAPRVDVLAEPSAVIVNTRRPRSPIRLRVSARPVAPGVDGATIEPQAVSGWQCQPAKARLEFAASESVADFAVNGDAGSGLHTIGLRAAGEPALTVRQMGYRHTGPVIRSVPATLRIRVLDAAVPTGIRVGYAGGGNDRVDRWLRQLGLDVVPLDGPTIVSGDLSVFDTIVVGVFAFGTRPELSASPARLHAYVRDGGNLVTLYHRPWDAWDPHRVPPSFLKIGQPSLRWRVTDETAAVEVLEPQHPLLNRPNRIGAEDWVGWRKERGLYFAAEWDAVYRPLLSMADPGETPLKGALVSADIGKGRHTHTSLTLHHQMEQLVPGAFRLMANLVTPRGAG